MKKILFLMLMFFVLVGCSGKPVGKRIETVGMPNPWTDCGTDLNQAAKIAGFTFPLVLSNYNVRAMKGMIEINYPLDENRTVCVRKTDKEEYTNNGDISGVFTEYPENKVFMLKNVVPLKLRGDGDKVYVMNMSASSGFYSAYCQQGMTAKEIEEIYNIIAKAETSVLYPKI